MQQDITLPEVAPLSQRARFFKEGERDMIEISYVGSKDTIIQKVQPKHMATFKPEWDSYCDGKPLSRRPGTPLTDCPGVEQLKADSYIARNIHNLEELAVLSDGQCQALGHGTLTDRKAAQGLLTMRKMQADTAARDKIGKAAATVATPAPAAPSPELAEVKASLDALTNGMAALVTLLTQQAEKKKPGRPPKEKAAP